MTPATTGTTMFGSPSIQPEAKFEVSEIVAPTKRSMPPVSTTIVWPRLTKSKPGRLLENIEEVVQARKARTRDRADNQQKYDEPDHPQQGYRYLTYRLPRCGPRQVARHVAHALLPALTASRRATAN